jgi:hypothetical protein
MTLQVTSNVNISHFCLHVPLANEEFIAICSYHVIM